MDNLSGFFSLISIVSLMVMVSGLFLPKPTLFYLPIDDKKKTRLMSYTVYYIIIVLCIIGKGKDPLHVQTSFHVQTLIPFVFLYLLGAVIAFLLDQVVNYISRKTKGSSVKENDTTTSENIKPSNETSENIKDDENKKSVKADREISAPKTATEDHIKGADEQASAATEKGNGNNKPVEIYHDSSNQQQEQSGISPKLRAFLRYIKDPFRERREERSALKTALTNTPDKVLAPINSLSSVIEHKKTQAEVIKANINYVLNDLLNDTYLTKSMEENLDALVNEFGISVDALDSDTKMLLVRSRLMRDLLEGNKHPMVVDDGTLPVMLQKGEVIIFFWNNIRIDSEQSIREYHGGSSGVSIRLAKGLYYRTGGMRGYSVSRTVGTTLGKGRVLVTNKAIYIICGDIIKKIKIANLVTVYPYSNAVTIRADGERSKPYTFWTKDSAFMATCIKNAPNWD